MFSDFCFFCVFFLSWGFSFEVGIFHFSYCVFRGKAICFQAVARVAARALIRCIILLLAAPGRDLTKSANFQNSVEIHLRVYVHANENLDVLVDLSFGLARLLPQPSALDFWGQRQMS